MGGRQSRVHCILGQVAVRVRFAPSPTGYLHFGNVRTALYNWLFARHKGGTFVVRVEDTDLERSKSHFEEGLKEDLHWLGLEWNEGIDVGGDHAPYRQTERFDLYLPYAQRLLDEEKAYYCFCSAERLEQERSRQLAAGKSPHYSGECRGISLREARTRKDQGEQATLRMKVRGGTAAFADAVFGRLQVDCSEIGDFVLLRSDGSPQYNFACVMDDWLMEISDVIRGEGHISNTYRQVLVYEALNFDHPNFAHLSTIMGPDGAKLSKRHGATSIREYRNQGYLAEAILNYLALLGWAPPEEGGEILELGELTGAFDLSRVSRSPAAFDHDKLNWVNRSHMKKLGTENLARRALPHLRENGWIPTATTSQVEQWVGALMETVFKYLDSLHQVVEQARIIFEFNPRDSIADPEVARILSSESALTVIREFLAQIQPHPVLEAETYRAAVKKVKETTGQKGPNLFHPIRVAVTGRTSGPELDKLVPLLDTGSRLDLPVEIRGVKERVQSMLDLAQ